ncbi:hypothetical protein DFH11DRAFT_1501780 [Phellopilus nigrolimitatus]|nr:hypothetical protein DFH11DRAFT_1501780 [Phellopilus nigrolimitatus]
MDVLPKLSLRAAPIVRFSRPTLTGLRTLSSSSPHLSSSSKAPPFDPAPAFRWSGSPDERWPLGGGLGDASALAREWKAGEALGWKTFDLDAMEKYLAYRMLISTVTPRPIALVSTLSEDGVPNLAPFSYFSLISHDPPLLSVSFVIQPDGPKDTPANIISTKEFVVNIISEPFLDAANSTSVDAPPDVDEWTVSGLTSEPSDVVKPPRVRESAASFECELFQHLDIASPGAPPTHTLILGRIRRAHVRHAVLAPDGVQADPAALRAVSRLGGSTYARVGPGMDIPRLAWHERGDEVRKLIDRKKGTKEGEM